MQTKHVISKASSSTNEILTITLYQEHTLCTRRCSMFISGLFFWISLCQTYQYHTFPFSFVQYKTQILNFKPILAPSGLAPGDICSSVPLGPLATPQADPACSVMAANVTSRLWRIPIITLVFVNILKHRHFLLRCICFRHPRHYSPRVNNLKLCSHKINFPPLKNSCRSLCMVHSASS